MLFLDPRHLENNQLEGPIPPSLGQLPKLNELYVFKAKCAIHTWYSTESMSRVAFTGVANTNTNTIFFLLRPDLTDFSKTTNSPEAFQTA